MRIGDLDALEHEFMTKRRYLDKDQVLDAAYTINKAPTIDAVPVVRCGECEHCDPENMHCDHPMGTALPAQRKPNDFCSYGSRRKDGET